MLKMKFLPASYGDSILLSWTHDDIPVNILIDGGATKVFKPAILPEIKEIIDRDENLDVVITTHIDYDHITGILELADEINEGKLPKNTVKQWWFNSGKLIETNRNLPTTKNKDIYPKRERTASANTTVSLRQGVSFEKILTALGGWHSHLITKDLDPFEIGGAVLTFLSPDNKTLDKLSKEWEKYVSKENSGNVSARKNDYDKTIEELANRPQKADSSVFNASSIAFLLEYGTNSVLLLADAVPKVYLASIKELLEKRGLEKLDVDYIKLPHHGSRFSFDSELLNLVNCQNFIISTNNTIFYHPHKTALAKILLHENRDVKKKTYFHFNYDNPNLKSIFKLEYDSGLDAKYNFECLFPQDDWNGYEFKLKNE